MSKYKVGQKLRYNGGQPDVTEMSVAEIEAKLGVQAGTLR